MFRGPLSPGDMTSASPNLKWVSVAADRSFCRFGFAEHLFGDEIRYWSLPGVVGSGCRDGPCPGAVGRVSYCLVMAGGGDGDR